MAVFNVVLVDVDERANFGRRQPSPAEFKEAIRRDLQTFFGRIVAPVNGIRPLRPGGQGSFDAAAVNWQSCGAQFRVAPWDIVLFFIPNASFNLLSPIGSATVPSGRLDLGWTVFSTSPAGQTGSQVYTQVNLMDPNTRRVGAVLPSAPDLAGVAFHEAMHNKLHWGDPQLHNLSGGSLSRSPYISGSRPNDVDINVMRNALRQPRGPFTGGCSEYTRLQQQLQQTRNDLRGL
jgi:hypothetical protein